MTDPAARNVRLSIAPPFPFSLRNAKRSHDVFSGGSLREMCVPKTPVYRLQPTAYSLPQPIDEILCGVLVLWMRLAGMDENDIDAQAFETLGKFDAHDA